MRDKLWWGILGEKFFLSLIKMLFPKKQGYTYEFNDFRNYSNGYGLDILVYHNGSPFLAIEIKNLHERKHKTPYGYAWAKDEVLNRFWDEKTKFPHKLLLTTFKSNHGKPATNLFKSYGINVFTTEKFIEKTDFPRRNKKEDNQFFYATKTRLEQFIKQITQQKRFFGVNVCDIKSLDNYITSDTIDTDTNLIDNTRNPIPTNKKVKNKPLKVVPEFSYEQYCKDMAIT